MEFDIFINEIIDMLYSMIDETLDISVNTIIKNNDNFLNGICIRSDRSNAAPTIYMDAYYVEYCNGRPLEEIAEAIKDIYLENRLDDDFDISFFKDYENVRNKIYAKLVNYEKNHELLKNLPYRKYLDMAIILYCRINDFRIGNASVLIRKDHLQNWNIDEMTVIDDAVKNTSSNMMFEMVPITKMLGELIADNSIENDCDVDAFPMYVVTNSDKYFGAIVMAMPDRLKEYSIHLEGDYYVIPSSVHEVILVPVEMGENIYDLNAMIREINDTQVSCDEVLSDHAYLYSRDREVLIF